MGEAVRDPGSPALDRLLLDPFVPAALRESTDLRPRLRLFLISHLLGPWLGLVIVAALYLTSPVLDVPFRVFTVSMLGFWAYPVALRLTGRFTLLAFLSLQHLTFIILFGSFHYGGLTSPFFFWLLVVPLFGFFYLGDVPRLRWAVLAVLAGNVLLFLLFLAELQPPSPDISEAAKSGISLVAVVAASVYVTIMALSHARLLESQSELRREVDEHRRTAEQLRSATAAAEAANRAKTEFLANMSHELRTPLNAIIGFSQIMRAETFGALAPRYVGYAKDIEDSGSHLLEVINQILDIVKSESGPVELDEEELDLGQVCDSVVRPFEPRAAKTGVSVVLAVPAGLPRLQADRQKLKQMVLHLVANAVKFTPPGGTVTVSAARSERGGLSIAVTDTGIGIAEEHLEKVLQPFFQVDASLSRKHEGTGLGLPLVAAMAAWHGAALRLTSKLGGGTSAALEFPSARVVAPETRDTPVPHPLVLAPA